MAVSFAQQRAIDAALAEYERLRLVGANEADLQAAALRTSNLITSQEALEYTKARYEEQGFGIAPAGSRPDLPPTTGGGVPNVVGPATGGGTPPTTGPTTPDTTKDPPRHRATTPGGTTAGGTTGPTTPPPPGPRGGSSPEWDAAPDYAKLMISALWPEGEWNRAARIPPLESGWNAAAHNTNGEDSRGWWQINVAPNANRDLITLVGDLTINGEFDPTRNTLAAYIVWLRQGWKAWSTYRAANIAESAARPGRDLYGDRAVPTLAQFQDAMGARDYPPSSAPDSGFELPDVGGFLDGLTGALGDSLGAILDAILGAGTATIEAVGDVTGEVIAGIEAAAREAIDAVGPTIVDIAGGALTAVANVANTLEDALDPVTGIAGSIAGGIVDGLGGVLGDLGGAVVASGAFLAGEALDAAGGALRAADLIPDRPRQARYAVRRGI